MSDSGESKKCILDVAAKLFARLGLDKTSTREIAKESKSNISLISYYFGGKEGLYKEVLRNFATELKDYIQVQIQNKKNEPMSRERFKNEIGTMVETMIYFRMKYPEISAIFAREKLTGLQHSKELHEEIFFPMITEFLNMFKLAQDAKIVRAEIKPVLFFILISEGVFGLFQMKECPTPLSKECQNLVFDPTELKKQITDIYTEGVLL
jgi:AcrR family transcriptional regulator